MLKTKLLHPDILEVLGKAGHGSHILIADGNYPFLTGALPGCRRVYLNLMPGVPTATDVLEAIASAIPIESAHVMQPDPDEAVQRPPVFDQFDKQLGPNQRCKPLERHAFYNMVRSEQTALVIATAEQRLYGNILLTIGVVST